MKKLQWNNDHKKWFVIDAPEMPECTWPHCEYELECSCSKKVAMRYQEALSKAPRWEVKNQKKVNKMIYKDINPDPFYEDWQPDPTKLYDLPKGYRIELMETDEVITENGKVCYVENTIFAILIPEEEVKPKPVKEQCNIELLELVCQLHSRALNYPSKEMHEAYLEARKELESRIKETESHDELLNELFEISQFDRDWWKKTVKSKFTITRK